jgi:hypothetical protein
LITRMILGEDYRILSSSLCSFLYAPVTSSLLGPNIPPRTLSSETPSAYVPSSYVSKNEASSIVWQYSIFWLRAVLMCSASGISSAVEMFWPYTHDFIDCHIHFGARENNTSCFNLLSVQWKTGLQYHCGWLAGCLAGCLSICSTVVTLEPASGMVWNFYARHATHQKAIYFYVFILYHVGTITERVSMHEDIHRL